MTISGSLIVLGLILFVYFLFWRLYLVIVPAILSGFEFWEDLPNWVKSPNFLQFVFAVFVLGFIRKKLRI